MSTNKHLSHLYATVPAIALALQGTAALGDIDPVSRESTVQAYWFMNSPPFGEGDSVSDGTTSFDYFSRSFTSGSGAAAQTSYLVSNGAFASAVARGVDNGSVMQHAGSGGTSIFTYVFILTDPTTLYVNGSLGRDAVGLFTGFGTVRIYDDVTGTLVYDRSTGPLFDLEVNFSDTYAASAGRYRFVVSAVNSGNGGAPGSYTSWAQALLTTPSPGAASLLMLSSVAAYRRRRQALS